MESKGFSTLEIDAIGEILNISLGASATALSTMLSTRVDISTPIVRVLARDEFEMKDLEPAVGVEITYTSGLSGNNVMILKRNDVKIIVEMLMGMEIPDDEFELNEMNISAICEVMNQMMGASSTALSEFLDELVNISTPVSFEADNVEVFKDKYFITENEMVCVSFKLQISDKLESEFMNLMPISLARRLVSGFFSDQDYEDAVEEPAAAEVQPEAIPEQAPVSNRTMTQEEIEAMLAGGDTAPIAAPEPEPVSNRTMTQEEIEAMLSGAVGDTSPAAAPAQKEEPIPQTVDQPVSSVMPNVQTGVPQQPGMIQNAGVSGEIILQMQQMMAQMQQMMMSQMQNSNQVQQQQPKRDPKTIKTQPLPVIPLNDEADGIEQDGNLEMIMGVPLEVSVEIGRTRKLVKEILEFTKGSLVVLDKVAGEQVDLFVNGQCIAKGDVVVVDDNFGIRITKIIAEEINIE